MEEEKDNTIEASPDALPPMQKKPAARPKAVSKIKPLLEGINAPYASADAPKIELTNSEKKLIHDIDIPENLAPVKQEKPKSVAKPIQIFQAPRTNAQPLAPVQVHHRSKAWLLVVIILGVAAGGAIFAWQTGYQFPFGGPPTDVHNTVPTPSPEPSGNEQVPVEQNPNPGTGGAESQPTSTLPSTLPENATRLRVKDTPTGYLNVRERPGVSSEQVTRVSPGETFVYTEVRSGWYHIQLADGTTGWVSGQYIQKLP